MNELVNIPVIWKKPHNSSNVYHIEAINVLLDHFIKKYRERLKIQSIMIDLEMPRNATGISNNTFIIKLHVTLESGKILRAESNKKSIPEAMKKVVQEIENESRSTDRQKHQNSARAQGEIQY